MRVKEYSMKCKFFWQKISLVFLISLYIATPTMSVDYLEVNQRERKEVQSNLIDESSKEVKIQSYKDQVRFYMGLFLISIGILILFIILLYFELKLRRAEIKKVNEMEKLLEKKVEELEEVYSKLRLTSSRLEAEKERYKKIVNHLPTGATYIENEAAYLNIEICKKFWG